MTGVKTFLFPASVRFRMLDNGHLQIRGIKKTDEGVYNCEARVAARGEIDYKKITVVVNGESRRAGPAVSGPSVLNADTHASPPLRFSLSHRSSQAVGGQRHGRHRQLYHAGV